MKPKFPVSIVRGGCLRCRKTQASRIGNRSIVKGRGVVVIVTQTNEMTNETQTALIGSVSLEYNRSVHDQQ